MTAPALAVDPWLICEPHVNCQAMDVAESIFSLSNGHLGLRGTLDEVDPCATRGTYLSGVYETHPLSYPEVGYGHPEEGQAMISVADGTPLRLLVDGVPLDTRDLVPEKHERTLDLQAGILRRRLRWTAPSGTTIEVRSQRLVSLVERSVCMVRYEVSALDGPAHVVVRSELVVGATPPEVDNDDPRVADALDHPFEALMHSSSENGGVLVSRTRRSGISVAAAVHHELYGAQLLSTDTDEDHVVTTVAADLAPGEGLVLTKTLGYAWSRGTEPSSLIQRAAAAVSSGRDRGWDGLLAAQRSVLDELWSTADVQIDGDEELQQALRYNVFQLFTASASISDAPIGAKGLTGTGYSGHTFWDLEGFVVPALTLLHPDAAARLLRWRASTLVLAQQRAEALDLQGASFAWRTIDGREVSAYWPASTAAMHLNADISRAFWLHRHVTGQRWDDGGFATLVETARLWISMGHVDVAGGWHLFGMTGPDEYTGVVDDNVFTNLMARSNLLRAVQACEAIPEKAAAMSVDGEEVARWRAAAEAVHIPWDENLGVHPMNENFTTYREWRFEDKLDCYPVQGSQHYAKFYRRQVLKQADLVQALWWCRDAFSAEEVARNLEYYEARTARDSSLSAAVQAVVCAQAQHPELALRYLRECALVDLRDVQGDTAKGLHMASIGGTWLAFVAGLGGLREDHEDLEIAPLLPSSISRTAYHVTWRGALIHVETTRRGTTLTLKRGHGPVEIIVDGTHQTITTDAPAQVPLRAPTPLRGEPTQPPGREPNT